jgi:hypothetical protein
VPAVFGANTGDDFKPGNAMPWPTACAMFVFGWFYPTTLTAARGYWGCTAATTHAEVAAATDEISFVFNRVTTDAVYDTTDADITVNNWWFICMFSRGTGAAWMLPPNVWIGTPTEPPTARTLTASTVGAGSYSGSGTDLGFGNTGPSDANAFQGDIGHVGQFHQFNESDPLLNVFGLNGVSSSALTTSESDYIYREFVVPTWFGDIGRYQTGLMRSTFPSSSSPAQLGTFATLDAGGSTVDLRNHSSRAGSTPELPPSGGTLSGATNSTTNIKSPRTVMNPAGIGRTAYRSRTGGRRTVWVR